jgi:polyhydroxybutyrate depolymerase
MSHMAVRKTLFGAFTIALVASCGAPLVRTVGADNAQLNTVETNAAPRTARVVVPTVPRTTKAKTTTTTKPVAISPIADAESVELPAQNTTMHITVDGLDRNAIVHIPARAAVDETKPWPVVIALHGSSSAAAILQSTTDFDTVADQNGFVAVYPEGLLVHDEQSWNAGQCCEPATSAGVNDVGFIGQLIDALITDQQVDAARVFVTGHSNGAILAQKIGCELADRVAAVASVAGALDNGWSCRPSRPMSLLEIHGTADQNVRYEYGAEAAAAWRALDDCINTIRTSASSETVTSSTCAASTEVKLVTIDGGAHAWPDDGAQKVWDFFAAQPPLPTDNITAIYLRLLAGAA